MIGVRRTTTTRTSSRTPYSRSGERTRSASRPPTVRADRHPAEEPGEDRRRPPGSCCRTRGRVGATRRPRRSGRRRRTGRRSRESARIGARGPSASVHLVGDSRGSVPRPARSGHVAGRTERQADPAGTASGRRPRRAVSMSHGAAATTTRARAGAAVTGAARIAAATANRTTDASGGLAPAVFRASPPASGARPGSPWMRSPLRPRPEAGIASHAARSRSRRKRTRNAATDAARAMTRTTPSRPNDARSAPGGLIEAELDQLSLAR